MRKRENSLEIAKKIKLGKQKSLVIFLVDNNPESVENFFRRKIEAAGYSLTEQTPDRETLIELTENLPEKDFKELRENFSVNETPINYTADVIESLNSMGGVQKFV